MSGKKRLERATKNIRVVAMPSKKKEVEVVDQNGQPVLDKNGEPQTEVVQLYKIKKMR